VQSTDARSDSRIDPSVARQLQLGSAVMMPICTSGTLAGVLSVFSRHPRAFDTFHIRRLERLASVIASALQMPPLEPQQADSSAGIGTSSDVPDGFAGPGDSRLAPTLLTPKSLAAPANAHPLHRLESLWNLIETAHHRRRSSNSAQ
jgi:hypothetical protein